MESKYIPRGRGVGHKRKHREISNTKGGKEKEVFKKNRADKYKPKCYHHSINIGKKQKQ